VTLPNMLVDAELRCDRRISRDGAFIQNAANQSSCSADLFSALKWAVTNAGGFAFNSGFLVCDVLLAQSSNLLVRAHFESPFGENRVMRC
jgi:hypothetical protein